MTKVQCRQCKTVSMESSDREFHSLKKICNQCVPSSISDEEIEDNWNWYATIHDVVKEEYRICRMCMHPCGTDNYIKKGCDSFKHF